MTALKLAKKIRAYTKQSSTSLSDADALLLLNDVKNDLAEQISTRDIKGNYFIFPTPTLYTLTASTRIYAMPATLLNHIYSVEIAFSSTTDSFGQLKYVLAFPDDYRRLGLAWTEANIQANYTNGGGSLWIDANGTTTGQVVGPNYEIRGNQLYILSGDISSTTLGGSTVANGIRLTYRQFPVDLAALTDDTTDLSVNPSSTTFGFPTQFHELWARKASIDWKAEHPGAVPPSALDASYAADLEAKLSGMENNDLSGEIIGRLPYQTGQNL